MNTIEISNFDQLGLILNDVLYLSGKQSEEIYHNMWCISLKDYLIESITLEQLTCFVDKLIESREQQLQNVNFGNCVIFYMWFDQQVLQLRFNVITGDVKSLPFGCKVQLYTTFESILSNFINTVRDLAPYADQIEFFNSEDEVDEEETEEEYILDVFVKRLRATIEA